MRALVALLVACAVVFGVYHYYFQKMPVTDQGTAPTQAISLTGVRSDLLQIAQAERSYIAENGKCATLDELISTHALAMTRTERDGYAYAIECSGDSTFTATGRHAPAAADSSIRYPTLAINQTMEVREVVN
jgi:Tfp pilus assembly protein PilE